jgi:hypothetical protein
MRNGRLPLSHHTTNPSSVAMPLFRTIDLGLPRKSGISRVFEEVWVLP